MAVGRGQSMVADSWGDANFEVFRHGSLTTVVFHEGYHAEGSAINDAYRTFAFGTRRLADEFSWSDLLNPGNLVWARSRPLCRSRS